MYVFYLLINEYEILIAFKFSKNCKNKKKSLKEIETVSDKKRGSIEGNTHGAPALCAIVEGA